MGVCGYTIANICYFIQYFISGGGLLGGLGDLGGDTGLLAAGGLAFFALYQAIQANAGRKRKREVDRNSNVFEVLHWFVWQGRDFIFYIL